MCPASTTAGSSVASDDRDHTESVGESGRSLACSGDWLALGAACALANEFDPFACCKGSVGSMDGVEVVAWPDICAADAAVVFGSSVSPTAALSRAGRLLRHRTRSTA